MVRVPSHLRGRAIALSAPLALLLVIGSGGCSSSEAFIDACDGIQPGMTHESVDARMRAVGGVETLVGESMFWQRETLFAHDACEVDFNEQDLARRAQYYDWSD